MDDALKTQLLDAVENPYVSELHNRYTGYMGVTTRDLLDHLMDRYGNITAVDLKANEARINKALDNPRPIDIFFQRINDSVQYANDGKTHLRQFFFTDGLSLRQRHRHVSRGMHGMVPESRPRQKADNFQAPLCR